MDFSIKAFDAKNTIASAKSGCVVVGVFENKKLSKAAKALDSAGEITAALKSGDITGKAGTTLLLRGLKGAAAERVLLVGLGSDEAVAEKSMSSAINAAIKALGTIASTDAIIALPLEEVKGRDVNWAIRAAVLAGRDAVYRTDAQKSNEEATRPIVPSAVTQLSPRVSAKDLAQHAEIRG